MSLPGPMVRAGYTCVRCMVVPTLAARCVVVRSASLFLGLGRMSYAALLVEGLDPAERRLRAEAERRGIAWSDLVIRASASSSARRRGVKPAAASDPTKPRTRARPTGYFPDA